MKVLVTGTAGFVGSHIADALLARGDEVVGVDNLSSGFRENVDPKIDFIEGDIVDANTVERAMRDIEVVFHQAAIRSVAQSVDDPTPTDRTNIFGTLQLLIAARAAGVRRFVYASSSSVYGNSEGVSVESQAPNPGSPYAVSKLAAEHYCRVWTHLHGLPTIALRYFNVFGPRQRAESTYSAVIPAFVSALAAGRQPTIHWDGEQSRDFVYIDDVVTANLRAAHADERAFGEVFNIGTGFPKTINEVAHDIGDALGGQDHPRYAPKREGDVRTSLADISKAQTILGWTPGVPWHDAVKSVVDWFAP